MRKSKTLCKYFLTTLILISTCFQALNASQKNEEQITYGTMVDLAATWELGKFLFDIDEYIEAKKCFKKIVNTFPDDAKALALLGASYAMTEDWDSAEVVLTTAHEKNPSNVELNNLMGDFFSEAKNYQKSAYYYKKSLENNSQQWGIRYRLMEVYRLQLNSDALYQELQYVASNSERQSIRYYWYLSVYHQIKGNLNESLKYLKICHKKAPNEHEYLQKLSQTAFQMHHYDEVIQSTKTFLQQEPEHQSSILMLGDALYQKKEWVESERIWKKALDNNPGSLLFTGKLMNLLLATARPQEARDLLAKQCPPKTSNSAWLILYAQYYRKMGHLKKAADMLKKIPFETLKDEQKNFFYWESAKIALAQGLFKKAWNNSLEINAIGKSNAKILIFQAKIAWKKGAIKQAQELLMKAYQKNPYEMGIYAIARPLLNESNFGEKLKQIQKSAKLIMPEANLPGIN